MPVYHLQGAAGRRRPDLLPYGFAQTSGELDDAVRGAGPGVLPHMLELARGGEDRAQLLARRTSEQTRRRVNALEYVMIPRDSAEHHATSP